MQKRVSTTNRIVVGIIQRATIANGERRNGDERMQHELRTYNVSRESEKEGERKMSEDPRLREFVILESDSGLADRAESFWIAA